MATFSAIYRITIILMYIIYTYVVLINQFTCIFKNSKQSVPIAIQMLFARNDQYHDYTLDKVNNFIPQFEGIQQ